MNTYINNKNFIYVLTLLLSFAPLPAAYKQYAIQGLVAAGLTMGLPALVGIGSRIFVEDPIGLYARIPGSQFEPDHHSTSMAHDIYQATIVGSLMGVSWFGMGMFFPNEIRVATTLAVPYFYSAFRSLAMDHESNLYRRCRHLLPTSALFLALSYSKPLQQSLPVLTGAFVLSAAINLMTVGT